MTDQSAELLLKLDAPDLDENELDDLTRRLREEIRELGVDSVEAVKGGPIPEGAMPVDWMLVGTLALKLAPIVIPSLLEILKSWRDRQHTKTTEKHFRFVLRYKDFQIAIGKSTSEQEMTNIGKELIGKIEAEQK